MAQRRLHGLRRRGSRGGLLEKEDAAADGGNRKVEPALCPGERKHHLCPRLKKIQKRYCYVIQGKAGFLLAQRDERRDCSISVVLKGFFFFCVQLEHCRSPKRHDNNEQ